MDIIKKLTEEFSVTTEQAQNVVNMLDEGNTIPFIARYRKELTGSMSDTTIRELSERLTYLRSLEERKETVVNSITEQGKMTNELALAIANAQTVTELEDIYRPYKPKRRTRATIAVEKGLTPLANIITLQQITEPLENFAKDFVSEEKEIPSVYIGEIVMKNLKDLDPVAYVRFASVYREFKDVNTFMDELKKLLQ